MKNKNMLLVYYPMAFVPFWGLGALFCGVFGAETVPLCLGLSFFIAMALSLVAVFLGKKERVGKLLDSMSLDRFATVTLATFVFALVIGGLIALFSRGWEYFPYILGTWLVLAVTFPTYLFPYLFAVYLLFYKGNKDFS